MEDIRSLSKDVKKFSLELDNFELYLDTDAEPPNSGETISKFRLTVQEALASLNSEHAKIQQQVAAATATSEKYSKLLSSMESLVKKRELQLSKYGFKPSTVDLPSYPQFMPSKSLKNDERNVVEKVNLISQKVMCDSKIQQTVSSTTLNDALIAKYTPAKAKSTTCKAPESTKPQHGGDQGDKTYVINVTPDGVKQGESKSTHSAQKLEDRIAKYSSKSNHIDGTAERTTTSFESSQELARRVELYSQNKPKQEAPSLPISLSQPVSEVKKVPDIESLLSRYDVNMSRTTSGQKHDVKKAVISPPTKSNDSKSKDVSSPVPFTPPTVQPGKISEFSSAFTPEESLHAGINPFSQLRQSLAFQDDDLERTVNVPHYSKPTLMEHTGIISTPDLMQKTERKTPSCITQDFRTPTIAGIPSEFSAKSESPAEPYSKKTKTEGNVNNENLDANLGASVEPQQVKSVSSIVSKYTRKYN